MPRAALKVRPGCQVSRALDPLTPHKNSLTPTRKMVKKQICSNSVNQTSFDAYDRILCSMSASADGDLSSMVNRARDDEALGPSAGGAKEAGQLGSAGD